MFSSRKWAIRPAAPRMMPSKSQTPIEQAPAVREDMIPCGSERLRRIVVTPRQRLAKLLLLPGYGDHAGRYLHFLKWLAERGIEAQAIDFRGHGKSTGRRAFVARWEEYLLDLAAFLGEQEG